MTETRKDPAPAPFRDASECLEAWFAALGPVTGSSGLSGHPSLLSPIAARLPGLRLLARRTRATMAAGVPVPVVAACDALGLDLLDRHLLPADPEEEVVGVEAEACRAVETDPHPRGAAPGVALHLAGGDNMTADEPVTYPRISLEEVLRRKPEGLLVSSMEREGRFEKARQDWLQWTSIPAVQKGKVHLIDSDLIDRPSPRVVDGLEIMAKLLHPEVFK